MEGICIYIRTFVAYALIFSQHFAKRQHLVCRWLLSSPLPNPISVLSRCCEHTFLVPPLRKRKCRCNASQIFSCEIKIASNLKFLLCDDTIYLIFHIGYNINHFNLVSSTPDCIFYSSRVISQSPTIAIKAEVGQIVQRYVACDSGLDIFMMALNVVHLRSRFDHTHRFPLRSEESSARTTQWIMTIYQVSITVNPETTILPTTKSCLGD